MERCEADGNPDHQCRERDQREAWLPREERMPGSPPGIEIGRASGGRGGALEPKRQCV